MKINESIEVCHKKLLFSLLKKCSVRIYTGVKIINKHEFSGKKTQLKLKVFRINISRVLLTLGTLYTGEGV